MPDNECDPLTDEDYGWIEFYSNRVSKQSDEGKGFTKHCCGLIALFKPIILVFSALTYNKYFIICYLL